MLVLPYAGHGFYGTNLYPEYDNRRLSRIGSQRISGPGAVAIRPSQTTKLHLFAVLSGPPVQQDAGGFLWRGFFWFSGHPDPPPKNPRSTGRKYSRCPQRKKLFCLFPPRL